MRRCLKILGWMGMGISAVLFAVTVVVWVRNVEHWEMWDYDWSTPRPGWNGGPWAGLCTHHSWRLGARHDHLNFYAWSSEPCVASEPEFQHRRIRLTAKASREMFELEYHNSGPALGHWTKRGWHGWGLGIVSGTDGATPGPGRPSANFIGVAIPFWMLAILFGLWPTLFILRRVLRRKRYGAGMCPHCGYDLRATPERCPECGREVVSKSQ